MSIKNELVLVVKKILAVKFLSFAEIRGRGQTQIAIGNPKTVPAGFYAEQTLRHLGIWEEIQPRLVFGEDVRQVLEYVARGEADFGIVYASDVKANDEKVRVDVRAPENSHDPILYPIAIVKNSKNKEAASKFIELVLSSEGQEILQKYGFEKVR